jgi:hypothetical protein
VKQKPTQETTNTFAELLSNSSSKIFLEAIDQIFDQENPVSQVENPDFSKFDPEMEKMYDKFCDSLDEDLIVGHGQSLIKDYSTEFDSEEASLHGSLLFPKKKIYMHDFLNISRENINKTRNLVLKEYCEKLEMIENFANVWKDKI